MDILSCLNYTDTYSLICESYDNYTSKCNCYTDDANYVPFSLATTNMHKDFQFSDIVTINMTDKWSTSNYNQSSKYCFQSEGSNSWTCETFWTNLNITQCICYMEKDLWSYYTGLIETKTLYKGLKNITFLSYHEILNKSAIRKMNSPSYDHSNPSHFDKSVRADNFDYHHRVIANINAYVFISLFVICGIFICFFCQNSKRRKNKKNPVSLRFVAEIDE